MLSEEREGERDENCGDTVRVSLAVEPHYNIPLHCNVFRGEHIYGLCVVTQRIKSDSQLDCVMEHCTD